MEVSTRLHMLRVDSLVKRKTWDLGNNKGVTSVGKLWNGTGKTSVNLHLGYLMDEFMVDTERFLELENV